MYDKQDSGKTFSRRAFVIGSLQIGFLGILSGRLAWLQLVKGAKYKTLADKNRINVKILAPSRGQIVDRNGVILAGNKQNFRVLVVPEQTDDIEKSLRSLNKHIKIEDRDIKNVLKQAKGKPKFVPVEIRDDLSWDEVARVEVNLPDLPGLSIDVGDIRYFPLGAATAHVIGYVGSVAESELTGDPTLSLPGFKIGKTAIEKKHDTELRGKAGASEVEVNVIGREVRELSRTDSISGDRVVLSLDAHLQKFVYDRLSEKKSASAVVMDVHSGALYALASYPSFDPNDFTRSIPSSIWKDLLKNPGHPLTNKAVSGQYPPASTFKMMSAIAGLRSGKINADSEVYCPGFYHFGNRKFHCWKKAGHGHVNLTKAIAVSCDTYFYDLATKIGVDDIAAVAREFGMGERFDFDLPEEARGLVPDKAWKRANRGERWHPGETLNASIGQGYLKATPLQLAVMTARIANGGYAVKPWLSAYIGDENRQKSDWPKMGLDAYNLRLIRRGMELVVNSDFGTARSSRAYDSGFEFAGKTGTAQVKRITKEERTLGIKNGDLLWKFRHHALFVGYAPYQRPKYACAVVVEHGGGGSSAAAPIARDILVEVMRIDPAQKPIQFFSDKQDGVVWDSSLESVGLLPSAKKGT